MLNATLRDKEASLRLILDNVSDVLNLFTINDAFGGWDKAAKDHFADNASFDQIYTKK